MKRKGRNNKQKTDKEEAKMKWLWVMPGGSQGAEGNNVNEVLSPPIAANDKNETIDLPEVRSTHSSF